MRNDIAGYLMVNPFIKHKLFLNDDIVGNITKAQFEFGVLREMQQTANIFNKPVRIANGFLKQIEPEALAAVEIHKGKYLRPKEVCYKVLSEEEFNEWTAVQEKSELFGHYSQLM